MLGLLSWRSLGRSCGGVAQAERGLGMNRQATHWMRWNGAGRLCRMAGIAGLLLTIGCVKMIDAGCLSYGEARLSMPDAPLGDGPWPDWVADTDDRMTGACR